MGKGKKARENEERAKRQKLINEYKPYQLKFNETGKGHFINPYTFFPLEDAEPERKKPERFYDDKLTGKLTCELKIANGSPLFIPNTTKAFTSGDTGIAAEEDHQWFDFFSYDDLKGTKWREEWPSEREPIIPGSSLRGMVRSVYEQLTNSCYSQIDEKNKTISELLERHAPCVGDELCPACRLFGTVNKEVSIGGRVRFSDGKPKPESYKFGSWTTLPALLSPKISATEFYLKRPSINGDLYWDYDYYAKSDAPDRHYDYKAKLNGRKVYLHHSMDLGRHYDSSLRVKAKTNVTVHPLTKGEFTFDVYFEDVDKDELTNLAFALGGIGDYRWQKLGHGKPLGMGSVKVKVQKIWKRTYTLEASKVQGEVIPPDRDITEEVKKWLSENSDKETAVRRRLIKHLACSLSSRVPESAEKPVNQKNNNMGQLVRYPTSKSSPLSNDNASFNWFKRNRGDYIKQTLHVPSLEDMGDAHE